MHQKVDVLIFLIYICPTKAILGKKIICLTFSPSFLVTLETFGQVYVRVCMCESSLSRLTRDFILSSFFYFVVVVMN